MTIRDLGFISCPRWPIPTMTSVFQCHVTTHAALDSQQLLSWQTRKKTSWLPSSVLLWLDATSLPMDAIIIIIRDCSMWTDMSQLIAVSSAIQMRLRWTNESRIGSSQGKRSLAKLRGEHHKPTEKHEWQWKMWCWTFSPKCLTLHGDQHTFNEWLATQTVLLVDCILGLTTLQLSAAVAKHSCTFFILTTCVWKHCVKWESSGFSGHNHLASRSKAFHANESNNKQISKLNSEQQSINQACSSWEFDESFTAADQQFQASLVDLSLCLVFLQNNKSDFDPMFCMLWTHEDVFWPSKRLSRMLSFNVPFRTSCSRCTGDVLQIIADLTLWANMVGQGKGNHLTQQGTVTAVQNQEQAPYQIEWKMETRCAAAKCNVLHFSQRCGGASLSP